MIMSKLSPTIIRSETNDWSDLINIFKLIFFLHLAPSSHIHIIDISIATSMTMFWGDSIISSMGRSKKYNVLYGNYCFQNENIINSNNEVNWLYIIVSKHTTPFCKRKFSTKSKTFTLFSLSQGTWDTKRTPNISHM